MGWSRLDKVTLEVGVEGPGRQGEWVKVRGRVSKRVENPIGVDI